MSLENWDWTALRSRFAKAKATLCRLEAEPVAEEVEPPAQVDVVVEHEEVVVEAAQRVEDVGADEHRGAGAEQHVLLDVPGPAVLLAGVRLVTHPVPGDGSVDEVDLLALPVEDLAGDGPDVPDGDLRELEFKKNQYGPSGDSILLRWQSGLFLPPAGASGSFDKLAQEQRAEHVFLDLLRRFTASNRNVGEWGTVFADPVVATAILDRLLHHSHVVTIRGESYRLRAKRRSGLLQKPVAAQEPAQAASPA